MAALTPDEIKALDFGYLTGEDLVKYCPIQFLIKQETIDGGFLGSCVNTAYAEVTGKLSSKCDITSEYTLTTGRSLQVVKITALSAIRNAVSNIPDVPQMMKDNFTWLDKTILAIRNGQEALPGIMILPNTTNISGAYLVQEKFNSLA